MVRDEQLVAVRVELGAVRSMACCEEKGQLSGSLEVVRVQPRGSTGEVQLQLGGSYMHIFVRYIIIIRYTMNNEILICFWGGAGHLGARAAP